MKLRSMLALLLSCQTLSVLSLSIVESPVNWTPEISARTYRSSWHQWYRHCKKHHLPMCDEESFKAALAHGKYRTLSFDELKKIFVYHRLRKYLKDKKPRSAYPRGHSHERKRDIETLKYHIKTQKPVSPICIAEIIKKRKGKLKKRFVKLDGGHRLIAAVLRNSNIRALFVKLGCVNRA